MTEFEFAANRSGLLAVPTRFQIFNLFPCPRSPVASTSRAAGKKNCSRASNDARMNFCRKGEASRVHQEIQYCTTSDDVRLAYSVIGKGTPIVRACHWLSHLEYDLNCGKSLLQNLITEILGGRSAKPHRYMMGQTDFNGDLVRAEHLMIEDEPASTDLRSRRDFGSRIKEITANVMQSCHPKHRDAITLDPFWRLTISVNDEPENLMVLPPLDDSLEDKLIILKTYQQAMPMPSETDEERRAFMEALRSELPAFVAFLFAWSIPKDFTCQRFGIKAYQHPEILQALGALTPEAQLLNLIDLELFNSVAPSAWEGTAAELQRELTRDGSTVKREAQQLLNWSTACGVYLGRLQRLCPQRFQPERTNASRRWIIEIPTE
jgi:uncharacterized protein DUF5906